MNDARSEPQGAPSPFDAGELTRRVAVAMTDCKRRGLTAAQAQAELQPQWSAMKAQFAADQQAAAHALIAWAGLEAEHIAALEESTNVDADTQLLVIGRVLYDHRRRGTPVTEIRASILRRTAEHLAR